LRAASGFDPAQPACNKQAVPPSSRGTKPRSLPFPNARPKTGLLPNIAGARRPLPGRTAGFEALAAPRPPERLMAETGGLKESTTLLVPCQAFFKKKIFFFSRVKALGYAPLACTASRSRFYGDLPGARFFKDLSLKFRPICPG